MDSRLKIAGMTPSFAIEVLPATLPWPWGTQRAEEGIRLVLREGTVTNYEVTATSKNGGMTVVLYNASTFRDAEGRLQAIVALTGYALPEDVAKAREAGFDGHLAKPAAIEALERVLAEHTGVMR